MKDLEEDVAKLREATVDLERDKSLVATEKTALEALVQSKDDQINEDTIVMQDLQHKVINSIV